MDSATSIFLSVFRAHFYGYFQKLNKNAFIWMITLFCAKSPESLKICQIVAAFFYLVSQNTSLLFLRANFTNFWKYSSQNNSQYFKGFFVKISHLKNFINTICDVTCNDVLTTLVNICDERVSVRQGCNGPVKSNGLPLPSSYDLVPVTKMHREYFKDVKKPMSGPSNVCFHVLHENPFTFPFECVQRCMMTFRMDTVKLHSNAFKSMSDVRNIHLPIC